MVYSDMGRVPIGRIVTFRPVSYTRSSGSHQNGFALKGGGEVLNSPPVRGPRLIRRIIESKYYVPLSLVCLLALSVGIAINVLIRTGQWPPALARSSATVVISGPGSGNPSPIQAYVLGAVRTPGVYALSPGSRVRDLIQAAGGALQTADLTRVNLASPVSDGESVYVPQYGETVPGELGGKINLNTATAEQMHAALGISLTTARKIVDYRGTHGDFTAVSQLLLVPISRTIYDRIKDLVTV